MKNTTTTTTKIQYEKGVEKIARETTLRIRGKKETRERMQREEQRQQWRRSFCKTDSVYDQTSG